MPTIHLTTFIQAPADRVFDLSRHIDLHKQSMQDYKEEAVSGIRFGLIEKDESVTWRARHFWKNRLLKVTVTEMQKPLSFTVEQDKGDFKSMRHEHHVKTCENGCFLIDLFHYETPYGLFGQWMNALLLHKHLHKMLEKRQKAIKETAEGGGWKRYLERS